MKLPVLNFPLNYLTKLAFRSVYTVITAITLSHLYLFLIIFHAYFNLLFDIHSLICDNNKVKYKVHVYMIEKLDFNDATVYIDLAL